MELPFEAIRGQNELHYTYLDTFGRPVVVYHKNNLVEQHIQEFEVCYMNETS
jgi:oligosaccharyltransferase complex subunit alpha (ribophorin I)